MNKKFILLISTFILLNGTVYAKGGYSSENLFEMNSQIHQSQEDFSTKPKDKDFLFSSISNNREEVQRVIVKTTKSMSKTKQEKLINDFGHYDKNLPHIEGFSAFVPESAISEIKKLDEVRSIYTDSKVIAMGNYNGYSKNIGIASDWNENKITGKNIGVAVLDTGIYPHSDLSDRVVGFRDFINGKTTPYDDNGHGTSVSGIIAGDGDLSDGDYVGVAPRVDLIGVKVLDSNGQGYVSNVVEALDWCIENQDKYNIRVINLSLGTYSIVQGEILEEAVNKAWEEGIAVVVAAGNGGKNSNISSPATSKHAISVGSVNTMGTDTPYDDVQSSFSSNPQIVNGVSKPEIFAPGENIISLQSPNGKRVFQLLQNKIGYDYFKDSGTSMSAPMVTGAISLILSENPRLKPDQVKEIIIDSSIKKDNLNLLNVANIFDIENNWIDEENSSEKPSKPTIPTTPTKPNVPDTPSEESKPNVPMTPLEPSKPSIPSIPTTPLEPSVPTPPSKEEITKPSDSNNNLIPDLEEEVPPPDLEANIPTVPDDILGHPFVKIVYTNKNIIVKLRDPDKYSNIKEIELEYSKLMDVINLFNTIDNSFTREDFLFFQYRLNKLK